MQLPDGCFGRRFVISVEAVGVDGGDGWDISEIALPERCVLWELVFIPFAAAAQVMHVRLALGDQLPTTIVMMDQLEPLIMGLGLQGAEPRNIYTLAHSGWAIRNIKQSIASMGRRLVCQASPFPMQGAVHVRVACVFSAVPTEVPDCLIS